MVASIDATADKDIADQSQSPSLRGSGRFDQLRKGLAATSDEFQSPSLRGSGRFLRWRGAADGALFWFQSPSLRGSGRFSATCGDGCSASECFNPLHCGAVVASAQRRRPRRGPRISFNPLHCGAVVASGVRLIWREQSADVFQSPSLRGSGRFKALGGHGA